MSLPRLYDSRFLALMMVAGSAAALTQACAGVPMPNPPAWETTGGTSAVSTDIATGGDTSATTSTDCPIGNEGCDCYGNGTCNGSLVCASQLCVDLSGILGGAGGATAMIGNSGSTGTGGVGSATGAGGSGSSMGGINTNGGTKATSGSPATGGNKTTGGAPATGGNKATGGAPATGGNTFWNASTYSSTGLPTPSDGHHNQGVNCIQCHVSGSASGAPVWMFGGTVYKSNGTTPAANVQIGINDGTSLYTTYSATNGNFWFSGSGPINWSKAQVRIRDANGEMTMSGATPASTCNLCHSSTTYPRITAP